MIKPIMRDAFFLNQKSDEATKVDLPIATDLEDTLKANREHCVGMAANMIGYIKRIIIVATGLADMIMINPVITEKSEPYETEEGVSITSWRQKNNALQKDHSQISGQEIRRTYAKLQRIHCTDHPARV